MPPARARGGGYSRWRPISRRRRCTAFAAGILSSQHAVAVARTVDRVVAGGGPAEVAEQAMVQQALRQNPADLLNWRTSATGSTRGSWLTKRRSSTGGAS